jgi:hypothetical protein
MAGCMRGGVKEAKRTIPMARWKLKRLTATACTRSAWSFPDLPPTKDWRFPFKRRTLKIWMIRSLEVGTKIGPAPVHLASGARLPGGDVPAGEDSLPLRAVLPSAAALPRRLGVARRVARGARWNKAATGRLGGGKERTGPLIWPPSPSLCAGLRSAEESNI